jgi:hypothetical protein
LYKRRKKCCVVIRLPELNRPGSGGGGLGTRRSYSLVCIRRRLHQHIALVCTRRWLAGCWRMLEAIGFAARKRKPCFRQFPTTRSSSLKFTSSSQQQQPSRHPGNGPARLEIDWRMQFTAFYFFSSMEFHDTHTNTSTISIQSIKRKFLPFLYVVEELTPARHRRAHDAPGQME